MWRHKIRLRASSVHLVGTVWMARRLIRWPHHLRWLGRIPRNNLAQLCSQVAFTSLDLPRQSRHHQCISTSRMALQRTKSTCILAIIWRRQGGHPHILPSRNQAPQVGEHFRLRASMRRHHTPRLPQKWQLHFLFQRLPPIRSPGRLSSHARPRAQDQTSVTELYRPQVPRPQALRLRTSTLFGCLPPLKRLARDQTRLTGTTLCVATNVSAAESATHLPRGCLARAARPRALARGIGATARARATAAEAAPARARARATAAEAAPARARATAAKAAPARGPGAEAAEATMAPKPLDLQVDGLVSNSEPSPEKPGPRPPLQMMRMPDMLLKCASCRPRPPLQIMMMPCMLLRWPAYEARHPLQLLPYLQIKLSPRCAYNALPNRVPMEVSTLILQHLLHRHRLWATQSIQGTQQQMRAWATIRPLHWSLSRDLRTIASLHRVHPLLQVATHARLPPCSDDRRQTLGLIWLISLSLISLLPVSIQHQSSPQDAILDPGRPPLEIIGARPAWAATVSSRNKIWSKSWLPTAIPGNSRQTWMKMSLTLVSSIYAWR